MQGVQLLSLQTRWSSRARRHPKALTSAACGMEAWKTKSTAQTPWTRSPAPLAPKAGHLHPARVLTSAGFRRSHRLVLCRGPRRAVAWNRVIPIPFLVQGLGVGRRNHHSMRATHGTRRSTLSMLKPCMRPDTPCWKWMPTSPSTYGQGLARPARPRRPPGTFPLVGASEKHGPGTKISSFVPGPRVKLHVPGLVTRW